MNRPNRVRPSAATAVLTGLALALTLAACGDSALDTTAGTGHDHGAEHALYDVPDGVPVPTLQIEVDPDPVSGVNVYVDITDFTVAPDQASTEAVAGEGHFHAYVDGQKVARFYNSAIHLPLTEGDHLVMVELSANDHSTYAVDGAPISDQTEISVPGPANSHASHEPIEATGPAPEINLSVTPDPKSGWTVRATVDNLTFAPRSAGLDHVDGEGHLHLYVDGKKVTRLYGEWWHLDPLPAGGHEVRVEATANNHTPYLVNGEPVATTVSIDVTEEQAVGAVDPGEAGGHEHDRGGHDGDSSVAKLLDMAADDADTLIEIAVSDGSIERDETRFVVDEGSTVGLIVSSETADQVHVHGYDLFAAVGPGDPAELVFTADTTGVFEVELEASGRFLFDLQVG